jgi:hypothetical protein
MTVTFYLKEREDIEEESVTITIIRKKKDRLQSVNVKRLDDLTAVEQQTMRSVVAIVEKYRGEDQGAKDLRYGL